MLDKKQFNPFKPPKISLTLDELDGEYKVGNNKQKPINNQIDLRTTD